MTKSLIKKEDYRLPTSYWCNRFLLQNGKSKSKAWWEEYLKSFTIETIKKAIETDCKIHRISFKKFEKNIMTLGYPSRDETSRIKIFENAGIEIRTGNAEWGAEPNKLYFVVKHGKQYNND
jgi:hypothetical protein